MARDTAGGSYELARDVGNLSFRTISLTEHLSKTDQRDVYRFQLTQPGAVRISLVGSSPNIQMAVSDGSGEDSRIPPPQRTGNRQSLVIRLNPSTYGLTIVGAPSSRETRYTLTLSTRTIPGYQRYTFKYHYGSGGDYYTGIGTIMGSPYRVGQIIPFGFNATGHMGYYEITSVAFQASAEGELFGYDPNAFYTTAYHNAQANTDFDSEYFPGGHWNFSIAANRDPLGVEVQELVNNSVGEYYPDIKLFSPFNRVDALNYRQLYVPRDAVSPSYRRIAEKVIYSPDPSKTLNQGYELPQYHIDQAFVEENVLIKTGFQALGLISRDGTHPPVLVFRGRDEALDDDDDRDPNGVGFAQFAANREAIAAWLQKFSNGQKPDVIGQGLGGALAQMTAAEFTDLVGRVVTFNSPGVSRTMADQFERNGGKAGNVTHYVRSGDLMSLAGESHLLGRVILQSYTDHVVNPLAVFSDSYHPYPSRYQEVTLLTPVFNQPQFNYPDDANFDEFLAGYSAIAPTLASNLSDRSRVETLRMSPGFSFHELISTAKAQLAPDQDNLLVGNDANNTAEGESGNDRIFGHGGDDKLLGNNGNDYIHGGIGNDTIMGDDGSDHLVGDVGNDALVGGSGSDVLLAGPGQDVLVGVNLSRIYSREREVDLLAGGLDIDRDVYVLGTSAAAFYQDLFGLAQRQLEYARIAQFGLNDVIQLHGKKQNYSIFSTLPMGAGVAQAIYLNTPYGRDLIAMVQTSSTLNLNSNSFVFV